MIYPYIVKLSEFYQTLLNTNFSLIWTMMIWYTLTRSSSSDVRLRSLSRSRLISPPIGRESLPLAEEWSRGSQVLQWWASPRDQWSTEGRICDRGRGNYGLLRLRGRGQPRFLLVDRGRGRRVLIEAEAEEFWQKNCLEKGHYKISHILINH